jgi:hypothetical protein
VDVMKLWLQLVVFGRGRQSTAVLFKNQTIGSVIHHDSTKP